MRAWDGNLAVDSALAAAYEVTMRRALCLVLDHHLGDLSEHVRGKGPASGLWGDHSWEWFIRLLETPDSPWFDLGRGERRDDILRLALRQAVDYLAEALGPQVQGWRWGRLHRLTFGHTLGVRPPLDRALSLGPFPIGGDGSTIWSTYTSRLDLSRSEVIGPPFRFIADLGDLDHCWGLLAPGQSGHRASKHYGDGVQAWFTAGYHPMLFRRDEVEQHAEARLRLEPSTDSRR